MDVQARQTLFWHCNLRGDVESAEDRHQNEKVWQFGRSWEYYMSDIKCS